MTLKISNYLPLLLLPLLWGCATFRSGRAVKVEHDIIYKTVEGAELKGDLYLPESTDLKPAVIAVHGGGWARKSGDLEGVCRDLAKAGYVVFSPSYRLSPTNRFPKAVEDIRDAVAWLKQNAAAYGVDTKRLAGWGYSSGGNLILLAGLKAELGLKAIVSGGTPADLTAWPKSSMVNDFIGSSFDDRPEVWKEASPINHVDPDSPPVFLYHGKLDWIVEFGQMEKMRNALEKKGRVVETHAVPFMGHLLVYFMSQKSIDLGIDFLDRYVKIAKTDLR